MPGFTPTKRSIRFVGIVSRRRESAGVEWCAGGDRLRWRAFFAGDVVVDVVEIIDEERERVMRVADDDGWGVVESDSEVLV